eukprot:gnl/TRDRNA2_/TRDRNA2_43692_c0_seq1.p2 gnl/TRDRNA2_/TRDRNA2_43692_c0~~gnl/TRDRNA2_/TRDRNA2_43692_c0_seq1.p2  ORF type:complete len:108 (-),score=12.05 gnl/TRDRNA2_/TRDRNA2_43692_c0_seq1:213-536(-)
MRLPSGFLPIRLSVCQVAGLDLFNLPGLLRRGEPAAATPSCTVAKVRHHEGIEFVYLSDLAPDEHSDDENDQCGKSGSQGHEHLKNHHDQVQRPEAEDTCSMAQLGT